MTATAANGLALMWEMLYIAASMRLPIVMMVTNRLCLAILIFTVTMLILWEQEMQDGFIFFRKRSRSL